MNDITDDFRAFAMAALKTSTTMLDSLSPEAQHGIDGALQGGARLELAFGPLPAFQTLALVLVEREGQRHTICTAEVRAQSLHS